MDHRAYIFLDEAGNFDFSANGTRYFVLTSVSAQRPFHWFASLDDLKYDCIEYGLENEYFHCSNDNRYVRSGVFSAIKDNLDKLRIDSLIVDKREVSPALREDRSFYPEMLGVLLKFVMPRELVSGVDSVIVITDTIPINRKRKAIERGIRNSLSTMLPPRMKYRILHHNSRSHYGLQVADYCCWAIHRKWQTGESDWFDQIKSAVRSESAIYHEGQIYLR